MVAAVLSAPKEGTAFKYDYDLKEAPSQELGSNQVIVNLQAAALNHRDVWILKGMYPGISPGSILGSDGVGVVSQKGSSASAEVGQRVLINPATGWDASPRAPEGMFRILGLLPCGGTLAKTITVEDKELVPCPEHLSTAEAAALPLAGLTAYRATFTKAQVKAGDHVLVTGIGGGVALFAMQFAIAAGAHVYVTSSSPQKIERAIAMGAKGGINYKDENCIAHLQELLGNNQLSAIIDGAGGPLFAEYYKVVACGGIIVQYGQTVAGAGVPFSMDFVAKNIELRGSTMGSRKEFHDMVAFVDKHKISPVVSQVWEGLTRESLDSAFHVMNNGQQFGKLVISIASSS